MKSAMMVAAGGMALLATACAPPYAGHGWRTPLKPISRLDCPESKGRLTRVSASPDGQACAYSGEDGAQVTLSLVKVSGDPDAALDPIEADLKTLAPPPAPKPPEPPESDEPSAPSRSADDGHKNVNINLPGINIHAGEDKANIHVGGLNIDADGQNDAVHMHGDHGPFGRRGHFSLDASDGGAIIRTRGGGRDVNSSLILASDHAGPAGWRVVGYEARGPRTGPLVVAKVMIKSDDHDQIFKDAKALVRVSAGG